MTGYQLLIYVSIDIEYLDMQNSRHPPNVYVETHRSADVCEQARRVDIPAE